MSENKELTILVDTRYKNENLIDILIMEEPNVGVRYATYNIKLDRLTFYSLFEKENRHLPIMTNISRIIEIIKKRIKGE